MSSDKGVELLRRAIAAKTFAADIKALRLTFGIPEKGFENQEAAIAWRFDNRGKIVNHIAKPNKSTALALFKERRHEQALAKIARKYNLPPTLTFLLENYLLHPESAFKSNENKYFACDIELPSWEGSPLSVEQYWKESGSPYVRLLIHGRATPEDVVKFVRKNWSKIAALAGQEKGAHKTNQIRITRNALRDSLISELDGLEKDALQERLPRAFRKAKLNRYEAIALIVKNEGYEITTEAVKKVIQRLKSRGH